MKSNTEVINYGQNQYEVTVTMDKIGSRHEVTEVLVKALSKGNPVTQKLLREVSIAKSVRAIQSQDVKSEIINGTGSYDLSPLMNERWTGSKEQCELVARLYRDAYEARVSVQGYIATRVNRPVSSINRWIRIARQKGFLGKSNGTRGGEV